VLREIHPPSGGSKTSLRVSGEGCAKSPSPQARSSPSTLPREGEVFSFRKSSLIPHPSSLIPHPSSLIPHPSSLIPHPSSLSLINCHSRNGHLRYRGSQGFSQIVCGWPLSSENSSKSTKPAIR
jgi:hypothetical protein